MTNAPKITIVREHDDDFDTMRFSAQALAEKHNLPVVFVDGKYTYTVEQTK